MIQIRMQQGLSQDARIIRQEVFVEEQGFHHEFDETDQTAWHLVLYENGHAADAGVVVSNARRIAAFLGFCRRLCDFAEIGRAHV